MTTVSHQGLIADCPSGLVQLWDLPLGYTDDLPTGGSNRIYAIDTPQGPLVVAVADTFNLSDADQRAGPGLAGARPSGLRFAGRHPTPEP